MELEFFLVCLLARHDVAAAQISGDVRVLFAKAKLGFLGDNAIA